MSEILGQSGFRTSVTTLDLEGNNNGRLLELYNDGDKTLMYMTTILPNAFKGLHLHRVRAARYVCIQGSAKIILYKPGNPEPENHLLYPGRRLYIPKDIATGLQNVGKDEVWLINYPDPAYDPSLKDEQVEYTEEELVRGVIK